MLDAIKSNKLLLIIAGTLVAIILIGLVAFSLLQSQDDTPQPTQLATTQPAVPKTTVTPEPTPVEAQNTDDFAALIDESLLEQPLATDPALLKDELVQLTDIQTQLNEQKQLLEQQHKDSDKLIELKEKQLLALEKQLESSEVQ